MALTNIDKFIESLMWMWNSPETAALFGDLKLALDKQGLAYKDGKIIKSQHRVSAEAKETVWPKFKVGDWVVHDISDGRKVIRQIINMTNKSYILDGEDFNTFYFNDLENDYHLWTIQDAKPGDVLAFDNETIVIFKDLYNTTTFHSYCHIEDGAFDVSKDEMPDWWEGKGFHPATKKQCELLLQKMHDAGYTFDFKKKELKKIHMIDEGKAEMDYCFTKMMNGEKVTPAWSEEEPQLKEGKYYECIKSYHYLGGGQYWFEEGKVYFCEKDGYLRSDPNNNIYVYDCKNWQSCFRPYTEKPDWSKEDRDYYDAIIAKLEVTQDDAALTDNQMEFLKSLKDRIVPQSQQDWSEEDEMESERVIGLLEGWLSTFIRYAEDCKHGIAWLKTIKSRIGG